MQAKERRNRHFRSSVGLMLNENYGDGLIPNTVQGQDFLYMPASDIPVSGPALAFLQARLQELHHSHVHKPRSIGTSDSLYQAYRRAFGQPPGMVHYDREPLYWKGKEDGRPGSERGSFKSTSSSKLRDYAAMFNGYDRGSVPEIRPASTVKSVSTVKSSSTSRSAATSTRPSSDIAATSAASSAMVSQREGSVVMIDGSRHGVKRREDSSNNSNSNNNNINEVLSGLRLTKPPSGKLEDNRHRLWTPGSEAAGFKPYSPFSDSLQDFGKAEAKYVAPEIKPEVDRTCDVLPAPVYKDALNKMLDIPANPTSSTAKGGNKNIPDILKLHGNPEYPNRVMEEKDVPNYVAWAKIYPYCPLTQVEGQDRPVFVPPRGFTPSTPSSKAGSVQKLRDVKKEKRKIMEGIKLLSASNKVRRSGDRGSPRRRGEAPPVRYSGDYNDSRNDDEEIHPGLKALPPSLAAKLNPAMKTSDDQNSRPFGTDKANKTVAFDTRAPSYNNNNNNNNNNVAENSNSDDGGESLPTRAAKPASLSSSAPSVNYQPTAMTRKLLDMKMKAPTGWYGGQTPTHTPTPDPSLPFKATRAWSKHYSPARIRRFMRAIGGDMPPTPEPEHF